MDGTQAGAGADKIEVSWASPVWRRFVLIILPVLAYANALRNDYQLDDFYRIVNNPHVLSVGNPWRFFADPTTSSSLATIVQYRPLMPLSFAIGRSLGTPLGIDAVVIDHLGNLLFHVIIVALVFRWFLHLLRLAGRDEASSSRLAGWAATMYAVHPVAGVPVNYLCSRDLLLMQLFALSALNAWARFRSLQDAGAPEGKSRRWALLAVGLVFVSMLAKQNSIALPLVLLAYELVLRRSSLSDLRSYQGPLGFAAAVLAFFAWTKWGVGFSDVDQLHFNRPVWEYPATMADAHIFYYLRNFVWPFEMRMLPNLAAAESVLEPRTLLGALVIAASLMLAWTQRRTRPLLCLAILCYWLMFAVTSSVRPFRYLVMDYRQVPSLPYLCLLAAWGFDELRGRYGARHLAIFWTAYLFVSTVAINRHWRDQESLWGQAVRWGTRAQGHVNYGLAIKARQPQAALEQFAQALEEGENVFARINIGIVLFSLDRNEEALASMRYATQIAPAPARGMAWYWLSRGHMMDTDPSSALGPAQRAVAAEPSNTRFLAHLVRVHQRLRQPALAKSLLVTSSLQSPELAELRSQLLDAD